MNPVNRRGGLPDHVAVARKIHLSQVFRFPEPPLADSAPNSRKRPGDVRPWSGSKDPVAPGQSGGRVPSRSQQSRAPRSKRLTGSMRVALRQARAALRGPRAFDKEKTQLQ
jgi:hypothetical protein